MNLDALIPRADLAYDALHPPRADSFSSLKSELLLSGSSMLFRKPDFQRETSHWSPDKVRDLVVAFANEDLVPSVILWRSTLNEAFVIDGAHRLSSLIAWVNDDYGDGAISRQFFGQDIPISQRKSALKAREMVHAAVGKYSEIVEAHRNEKFARYKEIATRLNYCDLKVQTLPGDAEKAESSFFRINKQGVKLDPTELTLLHSRHCPNAVAARAINQNGTGHPHWKQFAERRAEIEKLASEVNALLFYPELESSVVKLSDVPIAGRKMYPEVLSMLLSVVNIANDLPGTVPNDKHHAETLIPPDTDGERTVEMLKRVRRIAHRIDSDKPMSLGLDPLVYFYSTGGRHLPSSFLAFFELISSIEKAERFMEFTRVRAAFEEFLVRYSPYISQITRKARGEHRAVTALRKYFETVIVELQKPKASVISAHSALISNVEYLYLNAEAYGSTEYGADFSAEVKSGFTIQHHLTTAVRCSICGARLDYRSLSFDHRQDKKLDGQGDPSNMDPTHHYCNSAKDALVVYLEKNGGIVSSD